MKLVLLKEYTVQPIKMALFENPRPNAVVGLEFPFYLFCGYIIFIENKDMYR